MNIAEFRTQFQPVFEAFLREKCMAAMANAEDAFVEGMIRYAEGLAAGDGKRIRPYVAYLMYRAQGGKMDQEAVMKMLSSLELFHVFALIHDDVIDRGTMRHGIQTIHLAVAELLRRDARLGDIARTGEAQAILLGDLMCQWSQDAFFATLGIESAARERAAPFFRSMIEEVIVGQMIDVDLTTRAQATTELIKRKMYLKTSSYTFIRPMQIGAALGGALHQAVQGGADENVIAWCEKFGAAVGGAFQTQDDLLDLTIPTKGTGKTVFSDLHERQHTFFTQHIAEKGTDAQKTELSALLGTDLSEADRPKITQLFDASGALEAGRAEIARLYAEASSLADSAPVGDEWRAELKDGVARLRDRSS
jgi:geranylgeranyl diphosphate synthase type I